MEYSYKPTDYEIKLAILYTINALKSNADYTVLDLIISYAANVNYFELEQYIGNLIDNGDLRQTEINGGAVFCITPSGEETLGFFAHKIPGSIKVRLDEKVAEINRKEKMGNKIEVDYYPVSKNEYTVKCTMVEGGTPIMNFEFYAGSRERAATICSKIKSNPEEFYKKIAKIVNEE